MTKPPPKVFGGLRVNNALVRRHYIRKVLTEEWQARRGVRTITLLRELLRERYNIVVNDDLARADLHAMKAMKIEQRGIPGTFWIIPPWRMDMESTTRLADQTTILNEVEHRLTGYAMDSLVMDHRIFILTDRHCGRMIGEWIALLDWPEIGHVISYDHSIEILCLNSVYAQLVHAKLLGDTGILLLSEDEVAEIRRAPNIDIEPKER